MTTTKKTFEGVDKMTKVGSKRQRFVTMRNNNKAIIASSEETTKTIDDEEDENEDRYDNDANKKVFPPKKQTLCVKERWNRFQAATKKKIKESAKEMETLHCTQPQYYIGALGVTQGYCY